MITALLLAICVPLRAQSSGDSARLDAVEAQVKALYSGRPTITGIPQFIGGIQFSTSNVGVKWGDQSQSTTAAGGSGSFIVADSPLLGDGSTGNHLRVDGTSVTLQGNSFNGSNQLIKFDGSSNYPGGNGSSISNLNASALTAGTVPNTRLSAVPDGSVNLTTGAISSGKFGDNRLSFSTAALASGGIWQPIVLPSTVAYTNVNNNFSAKQTVNSLQLSNVASGTQCLHADASGNVTGTGADCGAGGGTSTSTAAITWQIDNFLGQVNGSQKTFTLSQTPSSGTAIMVVLDGLLQSTASDYTYTAPTTITMTTAPASNSSSFFVQYTLNTSTIPAAMLVNSTDTVSGAKTFLSTVTIRGYSNIGEVMISSLNFVSQSIATMTLLSNGSVSVLQSSTPYHIHCAVIAVAGSSYPTLVFGDSNGKLDFGQDYTEGGGSGAAAPTTAFGGFTSGINHYFAVHLKNDNSSQSAANQLVSDYYFESALGLPSIMRGQIRAYGDDSGTQYGLSVVAGAAYQAPSGTPSSIAFCGSANALGGACTANKTYSGHCELLAGPQHP